MSARRVSIGACLSMLVCCAGTTAAADTADRPMGHVFDWGHELAQTRLPSWNPRTAPPIAPPRWYRTIDGVLRDAGTSGLWFSGYHGLPFDLPHAAKEPLGWRTPAVLLREYRATGLSWDVNLEARAAANALARRWAVVANPQETAPTRRLSLIDPGYERAARAEILRLVPRYARLPYVHAYTGSDEPIAVLPRGRALRSDFARRMVTDVRAGYGWTPPRAGAPPTDSTAEGLRWLAYSRYVSDRFFAMKTRQAALVRRLDPGAVVEPNDYGFIDGFMPWDYTRLSGVADMVDADPYVSLDERLTPGRGRYNHGFAAKLLSDLTGARVRIVVQAFAYAGYRPTSADIENWTAQALRAGASDISFYALDNPRVRRPAFYAAMLGVARRLRGTRLPAAPVDPGTVVVYATASEGQARPNRSGDARYRTGADSLYTTYAVLGELAHGAFRFESDTRLVAEPARLDQARLVWLPRADTLDRAFAERLAGWVKAGGTLIVTDPDAFTRAPDGSSLADVRGALIGAAAVVDGPSMTTMTVDLSPLTPLDPTRAVSIPVTGVPRSFVSVPADATIVARLGNGSPAALARTVGAGRVVAFATNPMMPAALLDPAELTQLARHLQRLGGGRVDDPAWTYRIP